MPIAAKTEFMSFLSAALGIKGEQGWLTNYPLYSVEAVLNVRANKIHAS